MQKANKGRRILTARSLPVRDKESEPPSTAFADALAATLGMAETRAQAKAEAARQAEFEQLKHDCALTEDRANASEPRKLDRLAKAYSPDKAAPGPRSALLRPVRDPMPPHHTMLREFTFPPDHAAPDAKGRPFTLHRHAVQWCTPAKDRPDTVTLVGIKGGEKPVPLAIAYQEFRLWWRGPLPREADR